MAWTTLPTYVDGNALTAAQLNAIKDNINESGAAKVTAAGQILVSTGANVLAARGIAANRVTGGAQSTASDTFVNLTTVGPTVTLNTGAQALVVLTSFVTNDTANGGAYMAYNISGATTIAPAVERSLRHMNQGAALSAARGRYSSVTWQTGLNVGSHTLQARYSRIPSGVGNAEFDEREIAVLPLS